MQALKTTLLFIAATVFLSCSGLQKFSSKERKELTNLLQEPPLGQHYIGLAVYDLEKEKWLYRHHSDRLFTPASNTKILTFYTGLAIIQDSFFLADTLSQNSEMVIIPNGNPIFLHPEFKHLQPEWNEALRLGEMKRVRINDRPTKNKRFGPGWSWADYPYYYQAEVSSFPIYGNVLWAKWDSIERSLTIGPDYLLDYSSIEYDGSKKGIRISRDEYVNQYEIIVGNGVPNQYVRTSPFRFEPYTLSKILEDTFYRPTSYVYTADQTLKGQGFYKIPMDTVYRKMMLESDNFLAEQILLMASGQLGDTLSSRDMIDFMFENELSQWKNRVQWVDGSGLSRYNLFSPEFIIDVLVKVEKRIGKQNIPFYFPTGGKTGTIKYWYGAKDPYVFAKTGTLSNHHALSGFIKTKKGNWLAFSFFNDNYIGSSGRIKPGMQKVLEHIRDSY